MLAVSIWRHRLPAWIWNQAEEMRRRVLRRTPREGRGKTKKLEKNFQFVCLYFFLFQTFYHIHEHAKWTDGRIFLLENTIFSGTLPLLCWGDWARRKSSLQRKKSPFLSFSFLPANDNCDANRSDEDHHSLSFLFRHFLPLCCIGKQSRRTVDIAMIGSCDSMFPRGREKKERNPLIGSFYSQGRGEKRGTFGKLLLVRFSLQCVLFSFFVFVSSAVCP